jgi:hypothetical protein
MNVSEWFNGSLVKDWRPLTNGSKNQKKKRRKIITLVSVSNAKFLPVSSIF